MRIRTWFRSMCHPVERVRFVWSKAVLFSQRTIIVHTGKVRS